MSEKRKKKKKKKKKRKAMSLTTTRCELKAIPFNVTPPPELMNYFEIFLTFREMLVFPLKNSKKSIDEHKPLHKMCLACLIA